MASLRVVLVSSTAPVKCGVADYSDLLSFKLREAGVNSTIVSSTAWGAVAGLRISGELRRHQPDIVHVQYPSTPYGSGLAIHVVALLTRRPVVATIHEFTQVRTLRKVAVLALALMSTRVIFTTTEELLSASRWFPQIRRKGEVIHIGSNVPPPTTNDMRRVKKSIAYFGTFRPKKGLEDFVALAKRLSKDGWQFHLIGVTPEKDEEYFQEIVDQLALVQNVFWHLDLPLACVAERLAQVNFAYLPFPDGASERRGTLLATLSCGAVTITTRGPLTTDAIAEATILASGVEEALAVVKKMELDPSGVADARQKGLKYGQLRSWQAIAQRHLAFYSRLCNKVPNQPIP